MSIGATRAPLFWIAVSAAVGLSSMGWVGIPLLVAAGLWLVLAGWAVWAKSGRTAALLGAVAVAFYFYGEIRLWVFPPDNLIWRAEKIPESAQLRGWVASEPEASEEEPGQRRTDFEFQVQAIFLSGKWEPASGRVAATMKGEGSRKVKVAYGDVLEGIGFLARPREPRNPGEFDARAYREGKGIYFDWFPLEPRVVLVARDEGNLLVSLASTFRARMMRTLQMGLENDPEISGLMSAMLFGYRDGIDREVKDHFRATGTLHLFAVSGQNVAVVTGLLLVFLQIAGVIHWRWAWLMFPLIFIFCLATGMQPSAQRAFLMASIVMVGWAIYRPVQPLNLLGAAALLAWIWDPRQLFDLGFQLSFLVVAGLTLGSGPVTRLLHHWGRTDPWIPQRLVPAWRRAVDRAYFSFCALVAASLTAWLVSEALILYNFHLFAPISLVANIVIVPLASLVVVVSALSVAGGILWSGFSVILNQVNWLLLKAILWLVTLFASVPGGHFYLSVFDGRDSGVCRLTFLDGDGAFPTVIQYRGKSWLIDTGPEKVWMFSADPFRRNAGINFFEGAFLAQGSRSHLGGASSMVKDDLVGWIGEGGIESRSIEVDLWKQVLEEAEKGRRFWQGGDSFFLEEGLKIEVLWPDRTKSLAHAEDQGLVLRIITPNNVILWAGDVPQKVESFLLAKGTNLKADLLVQGESSLRNNLGPKWLQAVRPRDLIRPRQGYEMDHALTANFWNLAREYGIRVWLMDHTGALTFEAQGSGAIPKPFLNAKPQP